jgi:uncharacterized FlaG/YvyC family protein
VKEMIDPIQTPTAVAPSASLTDPSASSAATDVGVVAGAQKTAAPSNGNASAEATQAAQAAQTAASNGASDAQSESDAAPPLRLLIERDKATNHYVYKLYDSSGRIVREIPQESLADAQKQAAGSTGSLLDTRA